MSAKRQNNQMALAFTTTPPGEARTGAPEGSETLVAKSDAERPASAARLMEEVCERENLKRALRRVRGNKGSAGIDGMAVEELPAYLKEHWPAIRAQLLNGTYRPQPVRRVEIPKPDGGTRKLGIPTALDRFLQQAVLQVLQRDWDDTFSEQSYGFRPNRSAHQAVARAQGYIAAGYRWVVDIDLEKFFDRVNHDRLMGRVAKRVTDKRLLTLLRAFLNAGVMEHGLVSPTDEGTPQGGPLSPLLSNLVLDDLDRELERRGHRFVRYADDCNIYVRSERAGQRVMEHTSTFITTRLKLKVNREKSAVARPAARKFLGFSFTTGPTPRRRIAPKATTRFKARIRTLTRRTRGVSVEQMVRELATYLTGWRGYFGYCETPSVLADLDSWLHRRLRCAAWKQWKRGTRRFAELRRRGVGIDLAAQTAGSPHGPWRLSRSPALSIAFPGVYFDSLGLPRLSVRPTA
ncbi:MAG: group II intron reverse transcriptase/maturase [Acidobacteria bacterium RIFCSPLOWO2_12_FULL_66_10]|nr:MAG: group II intron reverse transcriptase/maturase [Acidobacteria bacterium RIFCSPLOWO2_12_FULL_66_10]